MIVGACKLWVYDRLCCLTLHLEHLTTKLWLRGWADTADSYWLDTYTSRPVKKED